MALTISKEQSTKRAAFSPAGDDEHSQSQSEATSQLVSEETIQACIRKQQQHVSVATDRLPHLFCDF